MVSLYANLKLKTVGVCICWENMQFNRQQLLTGKCVARFTSAWVLIVIEKISLFC